MACGMLRCATSSVIEDKVLQLDSSRLCDLRELGRNILKITKEDEIIVLVLVLT